MRFKRKGVLGITAATNQREYPITRRIAAYVFTDSFNDTRDFEPQYIRISGWRRVIALPLNDVWSID
jgi:hypothetical protein